MLALRGEMDQPYFSALREFVADERRRHVVYPSERDTFAALRMTPLPSVRVVILGQDPYHGPRQAHGLAFSVPRDTTVPPSLRNIFAELHDDLGTPTPRHGNLEHWARQGVLLLNSTLTVRAGVAASHQGRGWETFTDAAVRILGSRSEPIAFVFWGAAARKKRPLVASQHLVVESAHPSPLSASQGFFGSRPFSRINAFLTVHGREPVVWGEPVGIESVS